MVDAGGGDLPLHWRAAQVALSLPVAVAVLGLLGTAALLVVDPARAQRLAQAVGWEGALVALAASAACTLGIEWIERRLATAGPAEARRRGPQRT